jgi:hypothetical protein
MGDLSASHAEMNIYAGIPIEELQPTLPLRNTPEFVAVFCRNFSYRSAGTTQQAYRGRSNMGKGKGFNPTCFA